MDENLRWVAGIIVSVSLACTGFVLTAFRSMRANMSNMDQRIDDVKDNYVRRDDLTAKLESLERSLNRDQELLRDDVGKLRDDLQKHNDRVIEALTNMTKAR